jgi:hypothetical protein
MVTPCTFTGLRTFAKAFASGIRASVSGVKSLSCFLGSDIFVRVEQ